MCYGCLHKRVCRVRASIEAVEQKTIDRVEIELIELQTVLVSFLQVSRPRLYCRHTHALLMGPSRRAPYAS